MRENPKQPKNLEHRETSDLAFLSSRIEISEALKDRSVPLLRRREQFLNATTTAMQALRDQPKFAAVDYEMLAEDREAMLMCELDDDAFETLADTNLVFYMDRRQNYINDISKR